MDSMVIFFTFISFSCSSIYKIHIFIISTKVLFQSLLSRPLFLFQVPNYYKVITHPMDLSNVRAKLQTQNFAHYQTFHEFVGDCRLIFENCAIFNEVSTTSFNNNYCCQMNPQSIIVKLLKDYQIMPGLKLIEQSIFITAAKFTAPIKEEEGHT